MIRYEKIAISLPLRAAESVRRAVKQGRAASVSAYITAAVEEKSSREDLVAMLQEMLAETGGPATSREKRWVDYQLAPRRVGKPPSWPARSRPRRRRHRKR
jgi:Arc/MetJ-type ribon-helix-helix transcriptional regulator